MNIKRKTEKKETKMNKKESPNRKGTKKTKTNMEKKYAREKSHSKDHDVKPISKPQVFVKNWVIKSMCYTSAYVIHEWYLSCWLFRRGFLRGFFLRCRLFRRCGFFGHGFVFCSF